MPLQVIGAGFGRTGTLSLKLALEKLDCGPCYHMLEVYKNPGHSRLWADAADGKPTDWDALFGNYRAAVDWPACHFWRELAAYYPHARVILSLRDADSWFRSVTNTIWNGLRGDLPNDAPGVAEQLAMARKIVVDQTFGGRFEEREHAIDVYHAHNAAVQREIPAGRLLVFEARQGWEPLCRFLEREVPDEPYPRVNTTEDFRARRAAREAAAAAGDA